MANKPTPADFSPTVPDFPVIGQYQPVYGKFDLTTYVQGASDYEIMAFLVQCYNATLKGYSEVTQLSKDTVTAYNQLQTWVNIWFAEVDVQQEINNKLQSMYEAGTLADAIAKSTAIPPAVAQYLNSEEGTQHLTNITDAKLDAMAQDGSLANVVAQSNAIPPAVAQYLNSEEGTQNLSNVTADKIDAMTQDGSLANVVAQTNKIPEAVNQYLNSVDGTKNLSDVTAQKIEEMAASGALGTVITNTGTVQSTTTDWLQKNVTPTGSAVTLDKSLSIQGAAADSKATGDVFKRCYQTYSDTVSDIDTLFTPGSYHLTKDAFGDHYSELNLFDASEMRTYYSMLVLAPSTLTNYSLVNNNYDVTQILFLNGDRQAIFMRNSVVRKFTKFMEVCSDGARRAFNANIYPNPSTLDFYDVGMYTPTVAALNEYADELGEPKGWYSLINIAPLLTGMRTNTDINHVYQLLVHCEVYGETVWQRQLYISSGETKKTKWTLVTSHENPTYMSMFTDGEVDVNSLSNKVGTFRISAESLITNKTGIELSDDAIKKYYWTVVSIGQVTSGTYRKFDTSQFLIGVSYKNDGTRYLYYRDSYASKFNNWSLLYTNVKPPEPTPIHSPQKVLFMGDSFTFDFSSAAYNVLSYTRYLERMGDYACTNVSKSGASATSWYAEFSDNITSDYDTYFIAFGLNNDPKGLGTLDDDETAETFAGSMQTIIKKVYTVNPAARIIVWCMDAWYAKNKSDMAKEIADKYGCEYYSMKADAKIPLRIDGKYDGVIPTLDASYVNTKTLSLCLSETNHHPNAVAQYQLATYLKTII